MLEINDSTLFLFFYAAYEKHNTLHLGSSYVVPVTNCTQVYKAAALIN